MGGLDQELLIVVGGNAFSGALMLAGGFFVLAHNWRRDINWLFFIFTISTFLYTLFFIIAALQTEYDKAYFWWSLNVVDVFITIMVTHFVLRISNRHYTWRWFLIFTYVSGIAIVAAWFVEPKWFLPFVGPELYFPYYLEGGWLYVVMLVHFAVCPLVAFGGLILAYNEAIGIEKRRLEYIAIMLAIGYGIGCLNFFLVFNVPVDPILGMFVGFYILPIAYGIYATNLLDIRLVVKKAFYYAFGIAAIAAFLIVLILINDFLVESVSGVYPWTVPFVVAIIAFMIGHAVWQRVGETERLKYEFITVAAHKLRTPLTRIRWVIPELMARGGADPVMREGIQRIDEANNRLIELTNLLLEAAHPGGTYEYSQVSVDLRHVAWEAVKRFATQITEKKLVVNVDAANPPKARGDARRLAMVAEVFIENAVMYTPPSGTIRVSIMSDRRGVRFAVTDSGIGVRSEDQSNIFASFYRTNAARAVDTEGVGLGLSLAKAIIERQGGKIGVESEGEGKGSTFWFTMPIEKE